MEYLPYRTNSGDTRTEGRRTIAGTDEPMILNDDLKSYDRSAAINYAINWYDKLNTDYSNLSFKENHYRVKIRAIWCRWWESNPHGFPYDFESYASANSATAAR